MSEPSPPADDADSEAQPAGPLSLERLRAAFARMVSGPAPADDPEPDSFAAGPADDAVTPEGIVEALLFAGGATDDDARGEASRGPTPTAEPLSAETLAEAIRGVSPDDVPGLVERLNARYERDAAACRVEATAAGYRFTLAPGLERVADRLRGRVRATRLSRAALETLSVVAYRQPIDAAAIDTLRDARSGPALRQLVRNELVRLEGAKGDNVDVDGGESTSSCGGPGYVTTDRFLRLVGLASLDQLPRMAELDD